MALVMDDSAQSKAAQDISPHSPAVAAQILQEQMKAKTAATQARPQPSPQPVATNTDAQGAKSDLPPKEQPAATTAQSLAAQNDAAIPNASAVVASNDAAIPNASAVVASNDAAIPNASAVVALNDSANAFAIVGARTFARPNGPIDIIIRAPENHGPLTLHAIDRAGVEMGSISVVPGTVNVLAMIPALHEVERTVWLQLMQNEIPVGAPLWVTPLRAPPTVRTVRSIRQSNQQSYTRVVGWGDRAFDPQDPETAQSIANWTPSDAVLTSGFRVQPAVEAVLHTSVGKIRIAFAPDAAPATVDNFLRLAENSFYEGTIFHRVVPLDREGRPFVVQGGDPTGTGDGGAGWNLALEPSDLAHGRGVLGMARGDEPDSAGSQFYFGLSRDGTARLDGQYCTFAFMLDGAETLERLSQGDIGDAATGRPRTPAVLERVDIVRAHEIISGTNPRGLPAFVTSSMSDKKEVSASSQPPSTSSPSQQPASSQPPSTSSPSQQPASSQPPSTSSPSQQPASSQPPSTSSPSQQPASSQPSPQPPSQPKWPPLPWSSLEVCPWGDLPRPLQQRQSSAPLACL